MGGLRKFKFSIKKFYDWKSFKKCKIKTYFVTNPDKKRVRSSVESPSKLFYIETFPQHISSVSQQEADAGGDAGSHS